MAGPGLLPKRRTYEQFSPQEQDAFDQQNKVGKYRPPLPGAAQPPPLAPAGAPRLSSTFTPPASPINWGAKTDAQQPSVDLPDVNPLANQRPHPLGINAPMQSVELPQAPPEDPVMAKLNAIPPGPQAGPSPGALAIGQRSGIPANQLTGPAATFAEGMAARKGQPRTSDQFRPGPLPTNQESLLAGTTPNITASPRPGYGSPPSTGGAVTQQLGKPTPSLAVPQSASPELFAENGRPIPGSLDDRVAAAKARMPGRPAPASIADRLEPGATTPTSIPAPPPLPPTPAPEPDAAERARDKLRTSEGPSWGEEAKQFHPPAAPPVPAPAAEPTYTKFNPTPSPSMPAPVLKGPMTSPEDVAANKARRAGSLAERAFGAQARGIGRGVERDVRLDARRAGVPYGAMAEHRMDQQRLSDQFALKSRELGLGESEIASKERIEGGRTGADKYKTDALERSTGATNASMERRTDSEGKWGVKREEAKERAATAGDAKKEEIYAAEESGLRQQLNAAREGGAPEEHVKELEYRLKQAMEKRGIKPMPPPAPSSGGGGSIDPNGTGPLAAGLRTRGDSQAVKALLPDKAEQNATKAGIDLKKISGLVADFGSQPPDPNNKYPGIGPDRSGPMGPSMLASGIVGELNQIGGGSGDEPFKRASRLADELSLMQSRGPTSFRIGLPAIVTELQKIHPEYRQFILESLKTKQPATAEYLSQLLQGREPRSTNEVQKELGKTYWWMKRAR